MAIAIRPSQQVRRTALILTIAVVAATGALLAAARPVAACTCAMPGAMKDYATPANAIFTGTAGALQARGVPVQVDRWFWGKGASSIVWLAASSFGDSAACGTIPPKPGSAWLWIAWPAERGDFGIGLCSPNGDLATPEGRAMLEEATAVFPAVVPDPSDPTAEPAANPLPTVDPAAADPTVTGLRIAAILVLASLVMFGALAVIARRSTRRAADPSDDDDRPRRSDRL
jgi:hypothetical protein